MIHVMKKGRAKPGKWHQEGGVRVVCSIQGSAQDWLMEKGRYGQT